MSLRRRFALFLILAITASVSGTGTTAAAQASGGTICVALVVDGTPLGSNVSTGCAKVSKGATGIDVLQAAGHTVGFRSDGLVCTIDGLPKTGCSAVDDSHFWAYFHRGPGKTTWTYSTEGASTYKPVNASTEGWVYRDGTTATPANVPYAQICKTKPSPSPSPSHQPSHHPSAAPTPTHHTHSAAATASPSATAPPTRSHGRRHLPSQVHVRRRHHHGKSSTKASPAQSATPTISPSSAALVGGSTSTPGDGGSSTGLIIGIVAVLILGGAAAYRFRRSSSRP